MDENETYAIYMLQWVENLGAPTVPSLIGALSGVREYWSGNKSIDLARIREILWSWVDTNGGPRSSPEKTMLLARMILCLAYEDNRELEDMGYFEDLLSNYGVSRKEINSYGPSNPPSRT